MTPVYIAESTLDAQLVQDLLLGAGITAHVYGPNVAGAIPEVPATGLIRVVVEDGEVELALDMIRDWQTGPAPEDDDQEQFLDSQPFGNENWA